MANTADSLAKLLSRHLSKSASFHKALFIVKKNSRGRVWLIGGGVFRSLASLLYGIKLPPGTDFDFIVEYGNEFPKLEKGWIMERNRHGNPKFRNGSLSVDVVTLKTVHSIRRRRLHYSIKNYLSGVPMTIQSFAYEIYRKKLVGNVGLDSLMTKTIRINNKAEYQYSSQIKGYRRYDYLRKVARSMKFKAVIPK